MAEEGKGLSPAGHHRVRLPGEERHPAAAGDGRGSGGLGGEGEDGGRERNTFGKFSTRITKINIRIKAKWVMSTYDVFLSNVVLIQLIKTYW